jgi:hypothetical protein
VSHGLLVLDGTLTFRSRAEHAGYAATRIVAVHNLHYDLAITEF